MNFEDCQLSLYIIIEIQCIYVYLIFIILPHLHPHVKAVTLLSAQPASDHTVTDEIPMALVGKIYHES